jgi:hypothetical protein
VEVDVTMALLKLEFNIETLELEGVLVGDKQVSHNKLENQFWAFR